MNIICLSLFKLEDKHGCSRKIEMQLIFRMFKSIEQKRGDPRNSLKK